MQTRYRAAATALLLTATAGMAATGGAAQATGSHHAGAGASKSLTITLKSTASGVTVSDSKFRPGNTIFKVKNVDGKASKGLIQVLRLKPGYDIGQAGADFGQAFSGGTDQATIDAINRIYDNVVFYGGMEAKGDTSTVAKWAVKIDKPGTYLVLNFDAGTPPSTFTVAGDAQKRALPAATGVIDAVVGPHGVGNAFAPGKNIATSGWMSTTNSAPEPHFVDLQQVKKGTTNQDVTDYFNDPSAPPVPPFALKAGAGTGVISPGHTFLWQYKLPQGRYVVMCFMPSETDGVPHAIMGMHKVFNLG